MRLVHSIWALTRRLVKDESAQDIAEYALSATLLGLGVVTAAALIGQLWLPNIWAHIQDVQDIYKQ